MGMLSAHTMSNLACRDLLTHTSKGVAPRRPAPGGGFSCDCDMGASPVVSKLSWGKRPAYPDSFHPSPDVSLRTPMLQPAMPSSSGMPVACDMCWQ